MTDEQYYKARNVVTQMFMFDDAVKSVDDTVFGPEATPPEMLARWKVEIADHCAGEVMRLRAELEAI